MTTRTTVTVSLVCAALLAGAVAGHVSSAAGDAGPKLSLSATHRRAGSTLTVTGSHFPCGSRIELEGYVEGISPYTPQDIGSASSHRGGFSARWHTPSATDSLPWTVQAVQRCGPRTRTARAVVVIEGTDAAAAHHLSRSIPLAASGGGATTVDRRGLEMIAGFEGYKLNKQGLFILYPDPLGYCTAGYGHLVHGKSPCDGRPIEAQYNNLTPAQAVDLLTKDANRFAAQIVDEVGQPLNQSQLDALVCFTFNVGPTNFSTSTLLKLLNQGHGDQVPEQLDRWIHGVVKGRRVKLPGLISRRAQEGKLWTDGQFPPVVKKLPGLTGGAGGDCSKDDLNSPPSSGCDRVLVQIATDPYPGDTQLGLGVGVGSVTIQPSGKRLACLNPGEAPCEITTDIAAGTQLTVTPIAGSISPDPQSPPDSKFQQFEGACTGSGTCQLTPSASKVTIVGVDFIPAVVKLTLNASPSSGPEMSANGDTPVAGTDPISPIYCGGVDETGFPCTALARLYTDVTVQANNAGHPQLGLPNFSSNCVTRPAAPDYCDIKMNADETVTATFSGP